MSVAAPHLSDSYCFIIPCYNHSDALANVLKNIEQYQIPCFLIDDGSAYEQAQKLIEISNQYPWVNLVRLSSNKGKGAAVMCGFNHAFNQNFDYAIQIDADGQHDSKIVRQLIEQSKLNPNALISGCPVYDDSVPKHRLIARYITHFWVWIETLSFNIKDSMCGFRIYPLKPTCKLIKQYQIGKKMDFDTDIMVRLYWQGIDSVFVPTHVTYPIDGVSHFKACKDNLLISWMHTRLFFGMLPRIPKLIKHNRLKKNKSTHWSQTEERKGLFGIKLILMLYRLLGRRAAQIIMFPVISYFWLTGKKQRQASKIYLEKILKQYQNVPLIEKKKLTSFQHFQHFGESLLDKLACWQGDIKLDDIYAPNKNEFLKLVSEQKGIILICSHLGDIEMCRALAEISHNVKINALVHKRNAVRFNQVLKQVNEASIINLIEVATLGADTAILLQQKLEAGEWVAIIADRTSVNPYQRVPENSIIWANFLGKPAPFPKGPFVLSSALKFPVYFCWGLKPNGRFQIYLEHFTDELKLSRKNRQEELEQTVQFYANRLEYYCLQSPLDWFNFFDFWQFNPPETLRNKDE
ncbi:glycosyltransferase family 2 protein [Gilliamella apicola]|uniref:glycosyltransferase family 2 protein n=1 Tax=Gilliamella apicola TaxID=1196095 RepID=UPI00080F4E63|nr:glycosyltransferase family 2 protein [Gilliamella apis]OCF95562.1 acyltransferase [Gilliamella apis]